MTELNSNLLNSISEFLKLNDNFLVSCHINADGDAISSALAITQILDYLQKKYRIILHDKNPDKRFYYLKNFDKIEWAGNVSDFQANAAIICDTPTRERIGDPAKFLPDRTKIIKLDHHPDEDPFADLFWVDVNISSTTFTVYHIMTKLQIQPDKDLAMTIFSGLMYDTGRFSYQNTSDEDFLIASEMIKAGADPASAFKKIFAENSVNALKTIGKGLTNLETYYDNQVVIIYLDLQETRKNSPGEIEELAALTTYVEGSHIGYFIREVEESIFKISFRSKGRVNVNEVAAKFGGGGHEKASGCKIKGSYLDIKKQLLEESKKHLIKNQYLI
jgi:phosphoesterase RecJ-like protein